MLLTQVQYKIVCEYVSEMSLRSSENVFLRFDRYEKWRKKGTGVILQATPSRVQTFLSGERNIFFYFTILQYLSKIVCLLWLRQFIIFKYRLNESPLTNMLNIECV